MQTLCDKKPKTAVAQCGKLALEEGKNIAIGVHQSAAGFYVGTRYFDTELGFKVPFTRESKEYWPTEKQARSAIATGAWTQKRSL